MSPSTSSKSLKREHPSYQHMKQVLFTVDDSTDEGRGNQIDTMTANIPTGRIASDAFPKPNENNSGSILESSENEGQFNSKSGETPNLLLINGSHREDKNEYTASKSEPSEASTHRLHAVANSSETKPINPRPSVTGIERTCTGVSESNEHTNRNEVVPIANPNDSPPKKLPERIVSNNTSAKCKATPRRRGKWTVEEEEYVARVIQDFNSGFLNAPAGYTLRSYLSDKLQCDPMRITKKFTGESCIGKRVFHPAVRSAANATAIDKAQSELNALERRWRRRLELQQRESAKKAAASAAAASAASIGSVTVQGVPVSMLGANCQNSANSQLQQSAVTQAATWLDRANVILMGNIGSDNQSTPLFHSNYSSESPQQQNKDETSTNSSVEESLEHQMKEVQRLIYEGPMIQQTTADLPDLLLRTTPSLVDDQIKQSAGPSTFITSLSNTLGSSQLRSSSGHISPTVEPADKRMRINNVEDSSSTGAEDAEALVGFLRSVRASAAAGQEL